jgi:hypothetical protein
LGTVTCGARGHHARAVGARDVGGVLDEKRGRVDLLAGEVAVEVLLHLQGAREAVFGILGERLHHDRIESRGHVGVGVRWRRRVLSHVLVSDRQR